MEKDIQYDYKIILALNIINCNIFVECNNKIIYSVLLTGEKTTGGLREHNWQAIQRWSSWHVCLLTERGVLLCIICWLTTGNTYSWIISFRNQVKHSFYEKWQ